MLKRSNQTSKLCIYSNFSEGVFDHRNTHHEERSCSCSCMISGYGGSLQMLSSVTAAYLTVVHVRVRNDKWI